MSFGGWELFLGVVVDGGMLVGCDMLSPWHGVRWLNKSCPEICLRAVLDNAHIPYRQTFSPWRQCLVLVFISSPYSCKYLCHQGLMSAVLHAMGSGMVSPMELVPLEEIPPLFVGATSFLQQNNKMESQLAHIDSCRMLVTTSNTGTLPEQQHILGPYPSSHLCNFFPFRVD